MGNPIVGVLIDPDEGIRLSALSLLKTGKYTTPFSAWTPVVTHKEFLNRPLSELRTTFEVMTRLVGAECVPYCHHLLTQRLWTNRKTKQSLGALAAEALGQIGTPEAISALEAGKKRFNRVIRHAWRGTPKVHGQVKQPTRVANCLGACAPPHDLPSTTHDQRGSVSRTVGVSSMFNVG